jgi:hypothetical protein
MNKNYFTEFRNELLKLHKTLLDFQKNQYEGQHGKIASPQVLLGLVMDSPIFAWLRQVSELIVAIDELTESKEEVVPDKFSDLLTYSKKLLRPNLDGNNFEKNYYNAIRNDPLVALAHAKAQTALEKITL